jgi:hypothetical protein
MTKLHQLLAVQPNLKGQATKTWTDLKATFTSKRHLFEEKNTQFKSEVEGLRDETVDQSSLQTTVYKELTWASKFLAKAIDVGYQVDSGNREAVADLVTEDGEVLAKELPAPFLLQLEHRVKEVQQLLQTVPTLDPAKGFEPDTAKGAGIFKAREIQRTRTRKQKEVIVLAPATDKHPQQAVLQDIDAPIGHLVQNEWSGLITPAKKAEVLEQVEVLLRAVKDARSKANNHEVDTTTLKIGNKLLDFVLKPLKSEPSPQVG